MKEFQRKQEEAKLKAMQDEEEKQRLEEEMEKQREERIRLEKERREKKKQKEKERIQRKKEEGSYLTKEQREKLERARVQLEAAGVQVPARNTAQTASTNNGEQPVKKRVVYDDRRKKNQTNAKRKFLHHTVQIEYRMVLFRSTQCWSDNSNITDGSNTNRRREKIVGQSKIRFSFCLEIIDCVGRRSFER